MGWHSLFQKDIDFEGKSDHLSRDRIRHFIIKSTYNVRSFAFVTIVIKSQKKLSPIIFATSKENFLSPFEKKRKESDRLPQTNNRNQITSWQGFVSDCTQLLIKTTPWPTSGKSPLTIPIRSTHERQLLYFASYFQPILLQHVSSPDAAFGCGSGPSAKFFDEPIAWDSGNRKLCWAHFWSPEQ